MFILFKPNEIYSATTVPSPPLRDGVALLGSCGSSTFPLKQRFLELLLPHGFVPHTGYQRRQA